MTAPLLEIRDLSVSFPGADKPRLAADNVSLDVRKGEILALVGESGAGKSILGSAIMKLLPPAAEISGGTIALDGTRIDQFNLSRMRTIRGKRIAMVFQDPTSALDPLQTIGDQLIDTIRTHLPLSREAARARAINLLQEVGISAPARRMEDYPHAFSGGMRQRIVFAIALSAEPELVIADEPTTALDVSVQAQIIDLMRRLCDEHGTAFILVTHDLGVAAQAADRVAVLYAGRLAEIGPTREILDAPRHPYTKGLLSAIPGTARERLAQIPGSMPRLGAVPSGCAFNPRCERTDEKCRNHRPSLEGQTHQTACWHPLQGDGA